MESECICAQFRGDHDFEVEMLYSGNGNGNGACDGDDGSIEHMLQIVDNANYCDKMRVFIRLFRFQPNKRILLLDGFMKDKRFNSSTTHLFLTLWSSFLIFVILNY